MKKFIILPVLITVMLVITAFTNNQQPKSVEDYASEFEVIKMKVRDSYNNIAIYGAEDAFLNLRENLYNFFDFAQRLDSGVTLESALGHIATEFESLAASYAQIALLTTDIQTNADAELLNIQNARDDCLGLLDQINIEVSELVGDSSNYATLILMYPNNTQYPIDLAYTISILNSKRSIQNSFIQANDKIGELTTAVETFHASLTTLLYALSLNDGIYVAAAEAIRVKESVLSMDDGLEPLENLNPLTDDVTESWDVVNNIIDEIDEIGG